MYRILEPSQTQTTNILIAQTLKSNFNPHLFSLFAVVTVAAPKYKTFLLNTTTKGALE
jgi:hypothetical protein